jgi:hypothetical protein
MGAMCDAITYALVEALLDKNCVMAAMDDGSGSSDVLCSA